MDLRHFWKKIFGQAQGSGEAAGKARRKQGWGSRGGAEGEQRGSRGGAEGEQRGSRGGAEGEQRGGVMARGTARVVQQAREVRPPTTTLQLGVGMVVVAVLAKLAMLYDESKETERVARRARRFAEEQEELEALSREEWDAVKAARPQTPYESALTRSGARIRTGSWPSMVGGV
ncbi:unnamed protein product [Closterium sp. NIES-64]|nr:unnamed protein product [Closterium sp. NIES-64]